MTREEYKAKITELLGLATPENQARASELLTGLSEDYESILTASETHENRVKELTANNETLRAVNAKLFLKVGSAEPTPPPSDPESNPNHSDENSITFDNLFNEKGELL